MKKIVASVFLSFAMVISCLFALTACGGKKKIDSISVELVSTSYTMTNDTIFVEYGQKVEFLASDFKVYVNYNNNTSKEISLKTETSEGFTFESTLPDDDVTLVGEYKLTFTYLDKQTEVKVEVLKADVDMTGVVWDYDENFTYDGTPKSVEILADTLPAGVEILSYENNEMTNAGKYTAVANFTYTDTSNYKQIESMTFDWEIEKATYDMSNVAITTGYVYDGNPKPAELYNVPAGVTAIPLNNANVQTNAGEHEVEYKFEVDEENYNEIPNKIFKFKINKGRLNASILNTFVYTGQPQTLESDDISLAEGVEIESISNNTQTENGTYQVTLSVSYNEVALQNYEEIDTISLWWTIDKARYDMSGISWNYNASNPLVYNGLEQEVLLSGELPEGVTAVYSNNKAINANDYIATVSFEYDDEHYHAPTLANQSLSWKISRAKLTIKANDTTIYFGDEATNSGVTCTGFVNGETIDDLTGTLSCTYSGYKPGSAVGGTYYITFKGLKSDNYQISFSMGYLIVEKATIDVSTLSWDYSAAYNYSGEVYAPVLKNVPVGVKVTYVYAQGETAVANPTEVGSYTATAVFDESSNNYEIVNTDKLEILEWEIQEAVDVE